MIHSLFFPITNPTITWRIFIEIPSVPLKFAVVPLVLIIAVSLLFYALNVLVFYLLCVATTLVGFDKLIILDGIITILQTLLAIEPDLSFNTTWVLFSLQYYDKIYSGPHKALFQNTINRKKKNYNKYD